jgi:hypothetical protein
MDEYWKMNLKGLERSHYGFILGTYTLQEFDDNPQ